MCPNNAMFLLFASLLSLNIANCQMTSTCPAVPGRDGRDGNPGRDGRDGAKGEKGEDGPAGEVGPPGNIGLHGPNGLQGRPGLPGAPGGPGPQGPVGMKGNMGPLGPKGGQGSDGHQGLPGETGRRGEKGEPGGAGELARRNIKQFSWSDEHSQDTGKLKSFNFIKRQTDTLLKVSFSANARQSTSSRCSKWFFKFNGTECSSPNTIDAVIYQNSNDNNLRHMYFDGICGSLAAGTIEISINVGECPGYSRGDAHTGWKSVSRIIAEEIAVN